MLSCSTLAQTGFLPLVSLRGPMNPTERCHTLTLFAPILSSSGSRRKSRMPKERNSLRVRKLHVHATSHNAWSTMRDFLLSKGEVGEGLDEGLVLCQVSSCFAHPG
jgi:hypothetical protein